MAIKDLTIKLMKKHLSLTKLKQIGKGKQSKTIQIGKHSKDKQSKCKQTKIVKSDLFFVTK